MEKVKTPQERIREVFESDPDLDQVIATQDGMCFTNESEAYLHNRKFPDGKIEVVHRSSYVSSEEKPAAERPNAAKSIELVKAATTTEELDQLLDGEERKTVLEAIAKRSEELGAGDGDGSQGDGSSEE